MATVSGESGEIVKLWWQLQPQGPIIATALISNDLHWWCPAHLFHTGALFRYRI